MADEYLLQLGSKFSDDDASDDDDDDDVDEDNQEEETGSNVQSWRTLDAFTVPEPLTDRVKPNPPSSTGSTDDKDEEEEELSMRQVARLECETDDDVAVSLDEESDIIREIRAEITNKVCI